MPILLREGFGNLKDGTHTAGTEIEILGQQWASYLNNFAIEDRADGRKFLILGSSNYPFLTSAVVAAQTTVRFGFSVVRGTTDARGDLFSFRDTTTAGFSIGVNALGQVVLFRAGAERAASTSSIPVDTLTHVEVAVTLATGATGTVAFYLNGVADGSAASLITSARASVNNLLIFQDANGYAGALTAGWKFGDLVWHTDASPIGDVGVYYKAVDGDIGTPDFTSSAVGANNLMLDEIGPDEDATHNESAGTAGHRDQFSGPGLTGVTILEVCALVRARKTSTGTATLLLGMKENLTEDQSAAKALSEDYLTLIEGWATNPDTSAAWTAQQATDALISYEVGA